MIKHKDEWPELIRIAALSNSMLNVEKLVFLFALREVEDGGEGNEFKVKTVGGAGFKEQALWAIGAILKNDNRWQDYVRSQGYISYVRFFSVLGGSYGRGWHPSHTPADKMKWEKQMKKSIKEINHELERDPGLG